MPILRGGNITPLGVDVSPLGVDTIVKRGDFREQEKRKSGKRWKLRIGEGKKVRKNIL
jgi:hypothetical protein